MGAPSIRTVSSHRLWGAPSDQFIHLLWRPRSLCIFFILYGGPSDHFYAQYIGAPRSLSSLSIWSPSDHFLLIQYGGPSQITFIVYYMGPPSDHFLCIIFWGPLSDHFSLTIWGPSDQFLRLLYGGPLRSVSLLTI